MRTPVDALRSVARYTALALGPDYQVRMSTEKGVFARPAARVVQLPSLQMLTARWNVAQLTASYNIVAWPMPGTSADASNLAALDAADKLWTAFAGPGVGSPTIRRPADSTRGHPYRIPLYDYDGIPLDGATAFAPESARDPRDFLHMEAPPEVQVLNDPDEETFFAVAANIRMSWVRWAAVPSAQPVLQRVDTGVGDING